MTVEIGANCTVGAAEAAILSPSNGASSASRSTSGHRLFSGDLAMKIGIVAEHGCPEVCGCAGG
jgi:hypothetical protein